MMNELTRNQCKVTNHQVNVQFLLQVQPEWQRFVTLVKQIQELKNVSYHKLYDILKQHQHEVNEIRAEKIARVANPLALVAQQQQVYHPQSHPTHHNQNSSIRTHQPATRNRGKALVNSPQPIYDQEPSMVDDDDEMSKDKEIDKLMALISLSFKKIYKPTNNNLRTSSNTSRANQDNSPRIHRNAGYESQRSGNVAGAKETIGSSMVQKFGIQCYNCKEYGHVARESNLSTHTTEPLRRLNSFCYNDDKDYDYKESTIPLNEINSQIPPSNAITTSPLVLPTEDPEDSLIMGNKELNTIPEKQSDEFIKSSVEDLVLILSESEDTSGSDSECILPSCDDFSPIDVPEEKAVTFSNPLFNSNDDFISSDDESLSDEDILEDNAKIYSNPLFKFDDEYISTDVNPLFDEVLENIESKDSYDSNLDEPDLLVTPLSDANKDECFDSGYDDDEINVLDCEDGYYDSEGDTLYLKSLLNDDLVRRDPSIPAMSVASILEGFTDEPPLEENDDLFDLESKNDEWKKILYDAQINDLMSEDKIFVLGICEKIFSPTYVSLPFTDHHYIFFTYVVRIFLPHITYPVMTPFLISSRSEDTIFDPGISAFHFSHQSGTFIRFNVYPNILNESPMDICSSTRFTPNITMIWGESS
nr:hypothetical protein [Tanacetum cinerariifolium]